MSFALIATVAFLIIIVVGVVVVVAVVVVGVGVVGICRSAFTVPGQMANQNKRSIPYASWGLQDLGTHDMLNKKIICSLTLPLVVTRLSL
nr:hypothetical protein [Tanacetum cinerariifolium]